ncbi:MAG: sigma-70 family RNA polymerase sigma factor [Clostridiales bacterium]|nr:sigma-70 family RNA polymerase sigma factor [Clostridiales bacterium]
MEELKMNGFDSYIRTLPASLSRDEQAVLFRKYAVTKDEEVRSLLIEHNLRLVASFVCKHANQGVELDDLMQEGTIGLVTAIDKYDISKGVEFSTYASFWIKRFISYKVRNLHAPNDVLFQDWEPKIVASKSKEQDDLDMFDIIPDEDDFVGDIANDDMVNRFLDRLNKLDREIFIRNLGLLGRDRQTIMDIAEDMGLSMSSVNRRMCLLKSKYREYYLSDGALEEDNNLKLISDYIHTTSNSVHKYILEMVYGLNGVRKCTQKEIADKLGCSITKVHEVCKTVDRLLGIERVRLSQMFTTEEVEYLLNEMKNPEHVMVIECLYGLHGQRQMSTAEIEKEYGINRRTVISIKDRFLKKALKERQGNSM